MKERDGDEDALPLLPWMWLMVESRVLASDARTLAAGLGELVPEPGALGLMVERMEPGWEGIFGEYSE